MRPSCCRKEKKIVKKDPERGLFFLHYALKVSLVDLFLPMR